MDSLSDAFISLIDSLRAEYNFLMLFHFCKDNGLGKFNFSESLNNVYVEVDL